MFFHVDKYFQALGIETEILPCLDWNCRLVLRVTSSSYRLSILRICHTYLKILISHLKVTLAPATTVNESPELPLKSHFLVRMTTSSADAISAVVHHRTIITSGVKVTQTWNDEIALARTPFDSVE